jgi:hypothetical protein
MMMTETTNTIEPDAVDLTESLFDEKPANRLVWIVPSIVLHLLVFLVWYLLPEKERKVVESRDMVIKSEQDEQLKQFVEDSNLVELRAEVMRLQEIKAAMASIRAEDMEALTEFESEMRKSLDADVGEVLAELAACEKVFAESQSSVMQAMIEISKLYEIMQPLIEKKDVAAIVPYAQRALDSRSALDSLMQKMNEQFLLLPARLDGTDSVMSWIKDAETLQLWERFVALQERMFSFQSRFIDAQTDIGYGQKSALERIVREGPEYGLKIRKSIEDEKQAWVDYESRKSGFAGDLEKSAASEKELEKKLTAFVDKLKVLKEDKERLNKERNALGNKTPEEKKKREDIQGRLKELDALYSRTGKEKSAVDSEYRDAKKRFTRAEYELKRLKEPSSKWKTDRERMTASMDKSLASLAGRTGDADVQKEACALQQEALKLVDSLVDKVRLGGEEPK